MNTVLIGAQWGDEGKGKVIDFLTEEADVVVRAQGEGDAGDRLIGAVGLPEVGVEDIDASDVDDAVRFDRGAD